MHRRSRLACWLLPLLSPTHLPAQSAAQPAPAAVNVSGVVFGSYQYHLGGQNKDFNQFLLERAYVTVRATVGERTSVRVTTDVFQAGDQNGWTIRAKYAYAQYDLAKGRPWATALRAGMLHNVVVEHVEQFWPRFVSQVAIERSGAFASADVGVAAAVSLPARVGEVYAHVVNGPGYTRRETDRFKDFGARLTLTPLAGRVSGPLAGLAVSPWFYDGATASRFVRGGGGGAIAPVGEALARDRYGLFIGIRDPRVTVGADLARMHTVTDSLVPGATPSRAVSDTRGRVLSGFAVIRPFALTRANGRSRFGLVGRYDDVRPGTAGERYHFVVAGLLADLGSRASIVLDYQAQLAGSGAPVLPSPGSFRGLVAHAALNF